MISGDTSPLCNRNGTQRDPCSRVRCAQGTTCRVQNSRASCAQDGGGNGDPRCQLNSDPGPCRGSMLRYYFNSQNAQCEQFTYGGCRGNRNNFRSVQDCQRTCTRGGNNGGSDIEGTHAASCLQTHHNPTVFVYWKFQVKRSFFENSLAPHHYRN